MDSTRRGDPEGRRVAKRRAMHLAEAGRLARALDVLLQRADFDVLACRDLSGRIAKEEQIALEKAHGRIESRQRFKGISSHPLLEGRSPSFLYIDENGKSFAEPRKSKAVFSIGAVAMDAEEMQSYHLAADKLKTQFFGGKNVTFHEPHMRQRKEEFYFGGDVQRQSDFDQALDELLTRTNFTAFGVGIRKTAFADHFTNDDLDLYLPTDIYSIAIHMLLERYVDFLATGTNRPIGRLIFESQGAKEDAIHQLEYARVLVDGTQWVSEKAFRSWLAPGVRFTPKQGSDPMEIADMFSRDLYEWIDSDCADSPRRWGLFQRKIYCRGDKQMGKFGVKVFPDSDVRERVEAHRDACGSEEN